MVSASPYRRRWIDRDLDALLVDLPAVLLTGPRGSGKTTTASRRAVQTIRLDSPSEAAAFHADPDAALTRVPRPVLLDEWQAVPSVLGAVKRAVDAGGAAGSILLTGSVRAELSAQGWPATGRVVRVPVCGFSEREARGLLDHDSLTFLDRLAMSVQDLATPPAAPTLPAYLDLALAGILPGARDRTSAAGRAAWLASYVEQLLTSDVESAGETRDPLLLRGWLRACATNTAGVPTLATLLASTGLNTRTARAYDRLLERLGALAPLPAWSTNRLARLVDRPRLHLAEPALVAPLLGVDATALLRDGDLLGRVLESWVVAQLRAEVFSSGSGPRLHHVRTEGGRHEIDVLVEYAHGDVAAIEIKAGAAPTPHDARHLGWLRDSLGPAFVTGVVLHTGPHVFPLGDRLWAAPICVLWS